MPKPINWLLNANYLELANHIQEEVYYAYYELVYGTIYMIVKDHQATEDIIQDAFLQVVWKKPVFEVESSMRAWLRTVSRNEAINYIRKNQRHRSHLDPYSLTEDISIIAWRDGSVEDAVEQKIIEESINAYLKNVKPQDRMLLEYRWKQGLSYKEIGQRLNICENVVRQRLFRTRQGLRQMLKREWLQNTP
ncbi:RNA polymerase sigma factor [Paenibacillus puldeungensis]|uniref:RNA polymerase sigma factor n=1 Tax=Paenibacillus puldeungensis TaxID=696536 RepID=A0ABW3RU89_9BACL